MLHCDDARRRLTGGAEDPEVLEHVATCAECFDAIEEADPLLPLLRAALPDPQPAPALAAVVLARWTPPPRLRTRLAQGLTVGLPLLLAAALEALVGAEPGRIVGLAGALRAIGQQTAPWVAGLATVRDSLLGAPALAAAALGLTLFFFALWLRLALTPSWRSAR